MLASGMMRRSVMQQLMLLRSLRRPMTPEKMTGIRSLFTSMPRLVDKPLRDEFTRKKSEFRIPALDDRRVRERTMLTIPLYIMFFFFCYDFCWLFGTWDY